MHLARVIKENRIKVGLTQKQLAKKLGYKTVVFISRLENGQYGIIPSKVKKLAKALGISPEHIAQARVNDFEEKYYRDARI